MITRDTRTTGPMVVSAAICLLWIMIAYAFYTHGGLIQPHIKFALGIHNGTYRIMHPGIFLMSSAIADFLNISALQALYYLLCLHVALTLYVLLWALQQLTPHKINGYALILFAFALMVASHIAIPGVEKRIYNFLHYHRGFSTLRNATHTALLPYAFAAFVLLCSIIKQRNASNYRGAALAGLLLWISTLIKPSFSVSLIPAIMLYGYFFGKWDRRFFLYMLAVLLPSALLIVGQFYVGFVENSLGKVIHLRLDPWRVWEWNNRYPILSLLLATAFPLSLFAYRRKVFSFFTTLAWINLFISLVPYMLLFETNNDRDFEWIYLHARQVLFLCCVVEWWKWVQEDKGSIQSIGAAVRKPVVWAGVLFFAHAVSGFVKVVAVDFANIWR